MTYRTVTGSLAHMVCAFLHANRDEELTRADIAQKFACAPGSIDSALAPAIEHKVISRRDDKAQGCFVYLAGPQMPNYNPGNAAATEAEANKRPTTHRVKSGTRQTRQELPAPDISQIVVAYDRPMPTGRAKGTSKYTQLFATLDRVNASFTLPAIYKDALSKAISSHVRANPDNPARFAVRTIDAETVGVWRTK